MHIYDNNHAQTYDMNTSYKNMFSFTRIAITNGNNIQNTIKKGGA